MSDRQKVEQFEQHLADALTRIGQLERKIQTMRVNINANLNGHTDILHELAKFTNCPTAMHFNHVDVAES